MCYHSTEESKIVEANIPTDFVQHMEELQLKLTTMHEVANTSFDQRQIQNENRRKNDKGTVITIFYPGDWVLVATHIEHLPSKLLAKWTGPYLINSTHEVSELVFWIENIFIEGSELFTAHYTRMRRFTGDVEPNSEEFLKIYSYTTNLSTYEKFLELKMIKGIPRILVKWLGFSEDENTWEMVLYCAQHNPQMVISFLLSLPNSGLRKAAIQALPNTVRERLELDLSN
jgi:hypothetical protein